MSVYETPLEWLDDVGNELLFFSFVALGVSLNGLLYYST